MAITINFTDNSDEVLRELAEKIPQALTAMGLVAESHAKGYCPVDTGRLRNSIANAVSGNAAYIGTNVEYAAFVELGTSRMSPRPYLKPAIANHTDEYKRIAEQALKG